MDISNSEIMESKQYKAVQNESSKEYAKEFLSKTSSELKETILLFLEEKDKLTVEMKANPNFSLAEKTESLFKERINNDLKPLKVKADLSLEVMERLNENYSNTEHLEDTKQYTSFTKMYGFGDTQNHTKKDLGRDFHEGHVLNYHTRKKHLEHEMHQDEKYQEATSTLKVFKSALRDQIKPRKLCSDLAILILRVRSEAK